MIWVNDIMISMKIFLYLILLNIDAIFFFMCVYIYIYIFISFFCVFFILIQELHLNKWGETC